MVAPMRDSLEGQRRRRSLRERERLPLTDLFFLQQQYGVNLNEIVHKGIM